MVMQLSDFVGRPAFEKNDCAVRAFSVVSGRPYSEIYALFEKAGRQPRKGSSVVVMTQVAKQIGLQFKATKTSPTLRQFQKMIGSDPVVAVKKGHAFGFTKTGKTLDYFEVGARSRVWCYYEKVAVERITYECSPKGQYVLPL
jgi:ABC-type bacteriocin/lantibiotic exporter with double-glycine peptidase domain